VTEKVRVAREGKVVEIPGDSIEWNYRHTSFREGELLLGATLRLKHDDPEQIKARMDERRVASRDSATRLAFRGCFFKNPPASTIGTGKMIDEMGMKGSDAEAQSFRPCTRTSSSLKVRTRVPKTHSHSRKRFANACDASRGSSWNTRLSSGEQSHPDNRITLIRKERER
jgi:hypothetical protein